MDDDIDLDAAIEAREAALWRLRDRDAAEILRLVDELQALYIRRSLRDIARAESTA